MIAESLSQHDEIHVVPTTLSGIRVGGRRFSSVINAFGMWDAVRGVSPVRSIRMRERACNFSVHLRVGRGARTVLY
jgi:hypothetical protein